MTAPTYQYVDLPDASIVTTKALLTARENIADTVAARAMMCIHGNAGFGKTLAVNTCLHELEESRGEEVCRVTFRARPTARAVRYELFETLRLPGEPPRHPSEFDRLWKAARAAEHTRRRRAGEFEDLADKVVQVYSHPKVIETVGELRRAMVHLRARDGQPSLAELQRRAGQAPDGRYRLPKSSLGAVLRGDAVPTRGHVLAFTEALGMSRRKVGEWGDAWDRIVGEAGAGGPLCRENVPTGALGPAPHQPPPRRHRLHQLLCHGDDAGNRHRARLSDLLPVHPEPLAPVPSRPAPAAAARGPHRLRPPDPRPRRYTPPAPALRGFLAS
ncbi:hypothetical protein ACF087_34500 [Streptomyces goshikiensis]|uniref:hypothetical protein n=1 Tax=Streptomyces goshikiensis TaxID=1942 RepID=UPI0037019197